SLLGTESSAARQSTADKSGTAKVDFVQAAQAEAADAADASDAAGATASKTADKSISASATFMIE
ncbi:MAG: hypothetical protein HC826_01760, partial [Rhodospirillales bacterium]|nr:hypothetical protein [Rhodospirillales bacterium]